MNNIKLKAPAKINLSLDIVGKRTDGYHNLSMIMQTVGIYDTITISKNNTGKIKIFCDDSSVPCDKTNIAYKCAELFFEKSNTFFGIDINIEKKIPSQAGLAGGSSDGAAVLISLNLMCENIFSKETLCQIGALCGADIPFCIMGGTCLCEGIGEKITVLPNLKAENILICKPNFGVSTKDIFSKVTISEIKNHPDNNILLKSINENDLTTLSQNIYNCLSEITLPLYPEIEKIVGIMLNFGALGSMMSGSGPSVFGIFKDKQKAEECYNKLKSSYSQTFLVNTNTGIKTY